MAELYPPSNEELKQLTLHALAALAVRCAQRVQPLYELPADYPDREKYLLAVDHAIVLTTSGTALVDIRATEVAANIARDINSYPASCAARAVARACAAVSALYQLISAIAVSDSAYGAIDDAIRAVAAFGDRESIVFPICRDYEVLRGMSYGQNPEIGQGIDCSETGPLGMLWPKGPPGWYVEKKVKLDAELTRIHNLIAETGVYTQTGGQTAGIASGSTKPPIHQALKNAVMGAATAQFGFPESDPTIFGVNAVMGAATAEIRSATSGTDEGSSDHNSSISPPLDAEFDASADPRRLVISAEINEFTPTTETADLLAELVRTLNAAHVAGGGQGLEIDDWKFLVKKRSRVPAGGPRS